MLNADLQEYLSSSSDSAEEEEGVGLSARERRTAAMKDLLQHAKVDCCLAFAAVVCCCLSCSLCVGT